MKLFKSKKGGGCNSGSNVVKSNFNNNVNMNHNSTTSCVSGKSSPTTLAVLNKNEDKINSIANQLGISSIGERAMSPAQSEDSGLAAERVSTYATLTLPRDNVQAMGVLFTDRPDVLYPPVIAALNSVGPAADFLVVGDRIHQIDGISTIGLTNAHVLSLLYHGDGPAIIEIEYSLPEYISQNSLCVSTKITQITVQRENGCLGLTLRGGGDLPLIVTNIRPNGPVFKTGRIKPGDRLIRVDNMSLLNKSLSEAQQILKCGNLSDFTILMIEYDVSVMQSVEFLMGPLLIEIERPMNEPLGLVLSNNFKLYEQTTLQNEDINLNGIFIRQILPASISDRCGALNIGDQILTIDETVIENGLYTPDDVINLLDTNNGRGYTQIQILPATAIARKRGMCYDQNFNGYNTLDPRLQQNTLMHKTNLRKSSLQLDVVTPGITSNCSTDCVSNNSTNSNNSGIITIIEPTTGLFRTVTINVDIDCSQNSGIRIGPTLNNERGFLITQIIPDSFAERTGCIQTGDRIISINKLYTLDLQTVRQILENNLKNKNIYHINNWVEIEIEFNITDTVIPSSGIFNIKLFKKYNKHLGITVNHTNNGQYIITEIKLGSPAHRIGVLCIGDILLAVDSHQIQNFNIDLLLKDNKNDYTVLTIKRNCMPDFLYDTEQQQHRIYANIDKNSLNTNANNNMQYNNCNNNSVNITHSNSKNSNSSNNNISNNNNNNNNNNNSNNNSDCNNNENVGVNINSSDEAVFTPKYSSFRFCGTKKGNINEGVVSGLQSVTSPKVTLASSSLTLLNNELFYNQINDTQNLQPIVQTRKPYINSQSKITRDINSNRISMDPIDDAYAELYKINYPQQQLYSGNNHNSQIEQQRQILSTEGPSMSNSTIMDSSIYSTAGCSNTHQLVLNVRLETNGGPLGITLAGSEDLQKPIFISGLTEGGIAYNTGKLEVGDCLLSINGENVQGTPLSNATHLLQKANNTIDLKISRKINDLDNMKLKSLLYDKSQNNCNKQAQPQAIFNSGKTTALQQRQLQRPRSSSIGDQLSTSSGRCANNNTENNTKHRTLHVTLYKDKVYDDYGFSVSDGLYERGVYINRIRSGGPADICGILKPFDRIFQVNGTKTHDFDCCLTVPLIAAAGDQIDIIVERTIPE